MDVRPFTCLLPLLGLTALISGCATDQHVSPDNAVAGRSRADVKAEAIAETREHRATLTVSEEAILKK